MKEKFKQIADLILDRRRPRRPRGTGLRYVRNKRKKGKKLIKSPFVRLALSAATPVAHPEPRTRGWRGGRR